MKRIMIPALALGALVAVCSCSKSKAGEQQQREHLYGVWAPATGNFALLLANDSISYFEDEMDGIEFKTAYTKQDDNTVVFELPEKGSGKVTMNPETGDLTMVIDYGEGPQTINIPAYCHFDMVTTAPNIASTLIYAEDLTTIADTLRSDRFLPAVGDKGDYLSLQLPDGRLGWINVNLTSFVRSRLSPEFLEREYIQELENLRGHHDRTEAYSFKKMDNGKLGVMFSRTFVSGAPAQEMYYAGDLDGIHLNVTHSFSDYNEWEAGNMESATALDKPFEITMVESVLSPHINVGKRTFKQIIPQY